MENKRDALTSSTRFRCEKLDKDDASMIKDHINELKKDPFTLTPRSQCNLLKERRKSPPLYRLKIGR